MQDLWLDSLWSNPTFCRLRFSFCPVALLTSLVCWDEFINKKTDGTLSHIFYYNAYIVQIMAETGQLRLATKNN